MELGERESGQKLVVVVGEETQLGMCCEKNLFLIRKKNFKKVKVQ